MIPHERLAQIGEHLGVTSLSEETRQTYYTEAIKLGTIFMDGVLQDYIHKKSNGKIDAARQMSALRIKRQLRKVAAITKAAEKKEKETEKESSTQTAPNNGIPKVTD